MFGATTVKGGSFLVNLNSSCKFVCDVVLDSSLHLNDEAPNSFNVISFDGIEIKKVKGPIEDGKVQFEFQASKETSMR